MLKSVLLKSTAYLVLCPLLLSVSSIAHAKAPMDANKNGQITEQEYLNHFSTAFIAADKNFDSRLSKEEISLAMQRRMQESAKKQFKKLDTDKDNYISDEEYNADRNQRRDTQSERRRKQSDKWFDSVDENKNGFISRAEYQAFQDASTQKSIERTAKRAVTAFQRMDLDNDTRLSELEYVYKGKDPNTANSANLTNPFSALTDTTSTVKKRISRDGNSDGMITKSEDEAYRRYLFSNLDKDSDGVITKKEGRYLFHQSR